MATLDPHVIYNRYSDNLARTATKTTTFTVEPGYDLDWLTDHNAGRPVRFVETSGAIVFDFTTPVAIALGALFHANFEEDLAVTIEANATDTWGSPSFSAAFDTDDFWRVDRFPRQPWEVFTDASGWGAYRYWRLVIATNAVAVAIGDVWLSDVVRRLDPDFAEGRRPAIDRPFIEHATSYRTLRSSLGTTRRSVHGQIPPMDDTAVQDILDWILDADGRPFLFIPDGTVNEAWLAIHASPSQVVEDLLDHDASTVELSISEDGRGLEPTPSPLP